MKVWHLDSQYWDLSQRTPQNSPDVDGQYYSERLTDGISNMWMGLTYFPDGVSTTMHAEDTDKTILITRGVAKITTPTSVFYAHAHDLILFPSKVEHSYGAAADVDGSRIGVEFIETKIEEEGAADHPYAHQSDQVILWHTDTSTLPFEKRTMQNFPNSAGPCTSERYTDNLSRMWSGMTFFPMGSGTKYHTHTQDQICYVTQGVCECYNDDMKVYAGPGDLVLFEKGEPHYHGAAEGHIAEHLAWLMHDYN